MISVNTAEIIAVGSELVAGHVDTNGPYLSRRLMELGVAVGRITHVADRKTEIQTAVKEVFRRAPLVIVTGGLGPTGDDLTREAVAGVMKRRLIFHPEILERIKRAFASRKIPMPSNNRVQAYVPEGAVVLPNDHGTAPGWILAVGKKVVVVLPGPPREIQPMVERDLVPWVAEWAGTGTVIRTRALKVWGLPESAVDQKLRDLFKVKNPVLALLASHREVVVRFTATGSSEEEVGRRLEDSVRIVRRRLGTHLFGEGDETMAEVVGRLLVRRGWRLALAESCTGGLIGHLVTDVAGSSAYFDRGAVTYSDASKQRMLGVSAALLNRYGAVSAPVAKAMARGIRKAAGTEVAVAVTGIAGPGGGTPQKPVGLVYIAVDKKGKIYLEELHLRGSRSVIKDRTALSALNLLRKALQ